MDTAIRDTKIPSPMNAFNEISRYLGAAALFLFAGWRYDDATWLAGSGPLFVGVFSAVAFVLALPVCEGVTRKRALVVKLLVAGVVACAFGMLTQLAVSYYGMQASRIMIGLQVVALMGMLALNLIFSRARWIGMAHGAAFLATLAPTMLDGSLNAAVKGLQAREADTVAYLLTSRHDLRVVDWRAFATASRAVGGGLARIDSGRVLVIDGEGQFAIIEVSGPSPRLTHPPLRAPVAYDDYARGVDVVTPYFRVTGIALGPETQSPRRLIVAHHVWDTPRDCVVLAVSETTINFDSLPAELQWNRRFTTEPCVKGEGLSNEAGGRLAFLSDSEILLTIGGHNTPESLDPSRTAPWVYGTTVVINLETGASRTFTTGHRNPQGLHVAAGRIWETEHGPHGGDELNLLVEGRDYGWPRSTYGTDYGQKQWIVPEVDGDPHPTGVKPVFSWVPSVGVSNLIQVESDVFDAWRGDLLVGSLLGLGNGRAVFRMRLDDTRVVFAERLQTGRPVRDLIELDDGRILLWDGSATVQAMEPATHVFAACSGCHGLYWTAHGIGPDLMGVVGDRVARFQGAFPYSQALASLGGRWTPQRLDRFLTDPQAFAPGTTMDFPGIADPAQRARIIEYLRELTLHAGPR